MTKKKKQNCCNETKNGNVLDSSNETTKCLK